MGKYLIKTRYWLSQKYYSNGNMWTNDKWWKISAIFAQHMTKIRNLKYYIMPQFMFDRIMWVLAVHRVIFLYEAVARKNNKNPKPNTAS